MADADDEKAEEMKILQNRLDSERRLLNEKMEREKVGHFRHIQNPSQKSSLLPRLSWNGKK